MRILALDTTTSACSVALACGDTVHTRAVGAGHAASARVLDLIDAVLSDAGIRVGELTAIACCHGPGSFTGVRMGIGVAQGLALGSGIGVLPVCTLATLAEGIRRERAADHILVAMDARMGEVYWAAYRDAGNGLEAMAEPCVAPPSAVEPPLSPQGWYAAGTGFAAYPEALVDVVEAARGVDPQRLPQAVDCLQIARRLLAHTAPVDPAEVAPVYLRNRVTGG